MKETKERSDKAQKVIERMGQKLNRQMAGSLLACVHCGMCTDSCHYVLANPGDPTYAPAYKADRIRKIFKRHFDWTGRVLPKWVGAATVNTDEDLEELKDIVFGKCTNCRRCTINCPMGVDYATFNRMARGLLVSVGVMPEGVAVVSKDQWETGNQMGVLKEDYLDTLEWMEEELQEELDDPTVKIPVDVPDCEVVYSINPREVKYDPRSIADAAKIFHVAGENWTMPSEGWDMTNFGLFSGDDDLGGSVAGRLFESVEELNGKTLVISECGHGFRSTRCEGPNWAKADVPFEMESSVNTMLRYIKEGRIKVDKTKNPEPVTFHDSCNNARSCGLFEEPRELLNLVCDGLPGDVSQPVGELLLHRWGRGHVHVRVHAPTAEVRRRQSRTAQGNGGRFRGDLLPQLRGRPERCHPALRDRHEGHPAGEPGGQRPRHRREGGGAGGELRRGSGGGGRDPGAGGEKSRSPWVGAEGEDLPLAGRRILVADDEPDQLDFICAWSWRTTGPSASEPPTATKSWRWPGGRSPISSLWTFTCRARDVGEVFEMIREDPELEDLKICIITGKPELRKLIYDRSVRPPEGYVDKPVDEKRLLLNVRKVLEVVHQDA